MGFRLVDCVKQVSTTAGTADFELGASIAGFLPFSQTYVDLETFVYEAHAVDANGVRTGEWEVGIGQYHLDGATPKVRRLFKLSGSNFGFPALVSFSAGTKHISVTVAASQATHLKIGSNEYNVPPVFYVRADGDDGNSGLEDTAAGAFLTIDQALNVASGNFRSATINVGAGTFSDAQTRYDNGYFELTLAGAGAGSTVLGEIRVYSGSLVIENCSLQRIEANGAGAYAWVDTCDFVASPNGHLMATGGGRIETGAYSVSGGCSAAPHIYADTCGQVVCFDEVTIAASMAMANGWVQCPRGLGFVEFDGASFTFGGNTVTGTRYDIQANSVCNTHGSGASYLPGSVAGSTSSGGQYL